MIRGVASRMTKTAVPYARFSSDNQHEESIVAQLRAIREYTDKENVTLLREYIDEARLVEIKFETIYPELLAKTPGWRETVARYDTGEMTQRGLSN